jgi:SAM-dependent methyltransferase
MDRRPIIEEAASNPQFLSQIDRYRAGVWRDRILYDLILDDAARFNGSLTLLDVGCGRGFDDNTEFQRSLASRSGAYIGVEPDRSVELGPCFTQVYRTTLEDAPIPSSTVNIAFAIMVLEHLSDPQKFWDKIYDVLVPGGVFWGLTVDRRHPFAHLSLWTERLGVKHHYMRLLMGKRGEERYLNYPVYYRSNSPSQLAPLVKQFASCQLINFSRVGQTVPMFPKALAPIARAFDDWSVRKGWPGTMLVVRASK